MFAVLLSLQAIQMFKIDSYNKAEGSYFSHLNNHYDAVVKQLNQNQTLLTNTMASLETQASPDTAQDMLKKTASNLLKLTNGVRGKKEKETGEVCNLTK